MGGKVSKRREQMMWKTRIQRTNIPRAKSWLVCACTEVLAFVRFVVVASAAVAAFHNVSIPPYALMLKSLSQSMMLDSDDDGS